MRRSIASAAVVALITSLALVATTVGGGLWRTPAFSSIGIKTVEHIDGRFIQGDTGGTVLAVWMATGSTSTACLATLNEAYFPDAVSVAGPITVYCAADDQIVDGKVRHGLFLHMFLAAPMGDGSYTVNVYQEGARYYGPPQVWSWTP
jgi:hypothetical protein